MVIECMVCSAVGSVVCLSPKQSVREQVHEVVGCGTCARDHDRFVIGNQENSLYSFSCFSNLIPVIIILLKHHKVVPSEVLEAVKLMGRA